MHASSHARTHARTHAHPHARARTHARTHCDGRASILQSWMAMTPESVMAEQLDAHIHEQFV
eukprot:3382908-Alexandrium_andersonii.AAC.1